MKFKCEHSQVTAYLIVSSKYEKSAMYSCRVMAWKRHVQGCYTKVKGQMEEKHVYAQTAQLMFIFPKYEKSTTQIAHLGWVAHRRRWLPLVGHRWPTHLTGGVLSGHVHDMFHR